MQKGRVPEVMTQLSAGCAILLRRIIVRGTITELLTEKISGTSDLLYDHSAAAVSRFRP